ncbi:hypothetical protein PVAND_004260 [Polypedilum vanderplanki]|uniref:Geminin n=1 Tax=Polypedilum vanderplanki TaxID=319348 RepID=A0A9J6BWG0_POLVA|nr:hypothetical protein PVAND_004260 [Polypedilum vanderplanki]
MSSSVPTKVFIQVETPTEQQENIKNSRKVFNNLQKVGGNQVGTDKENLVGRSPAFITKDSLAKKTSLDNDLLQQQQSDLENNMKRKYPVSTTITTSKSSQTILLEPSSSSSPLHREITVEDLTAEKPINDRYWESLAEQRRIALQETLAENQELYERIANLEDELNHSKSMLEEARDLVTVLTEMLEEKEDINGPNASVETEPTDISDNNLDYTL